MGRCRDCNGRGQIVCPVCHGSKENPRRSSPDDAISRISSSCDYCRGVGYLTCSACSGTGDNPYDSGPPRSR